MTYTNKILALTTFNGNKTKWGKHVYVFLYFVDFQGFKSSDTRLMNDCCINEIMMNKLTNE